MKGRIKLLPGWDSAIDLDHFLEAVCDRRASPRYQRRTYCPVEPDLLPAAISRAIIAGPNTLSVVSYWEVLLKSTEGNLEVGDPRTWWLDALEQLVASPLAPRPSI